MPGDLLLVEFSPTVSLENFDSSTSNIGVFGVQFSDSVHIVVGLLVLASELRFVLPMVINPLYSRFGLNCGFCTG